MVMRTETVKFRIDEIEVVAPKGQKILEVTKTHNDLYVPGICSYQPDLGVGAIQTCDTCYVEVNGKLERACATEIQDGMVVRTKTPMVKEAQEEAMSRILRNHELYCTVCDNNNGNCEIHNTAENLKINHQKYAFEPKSYAADLTHPFYRYEPDQCILCGMCVEACQDLQVSEVLSIDWERERPRVIWDNDVPIDQSSCVSC
ncbi:MAG TPA: 2Fe-2S iron-sulfur cluster-binding protein, partial [Sporolactobacillaceae bacterium]|nr:2Fe-2S iron-sulfur cluster-binding protein [Sporolactobacillaceae bacterium]